MKPGMVWPSGGACCKEEASRRARVVPLSFMCGAL